MSKNNRIATRVISMILGILMGVALVILGSVPAGIIGGIIGAALNIWLSPHILKKIFGLFLLIMGCKEALALWRGEKIPPKA